MAEENKILESKIRIGYKSLGENEYFLLDNPLVILLCCKDYNESWGSLDGVGYDYLRLKSLFEDFYGWEVASLCEKVTMDNIENFFSMTRAQMVVSGAKHSGLLLFLCGHGTRGSFVAEDDPGPNEPNEKKHKRISMDYFSTFWNNKNTSALKGWPKIIVKVACRGAEAPIPSLSSSSSSFSLLALACYGGERVPSPLFPSSSSP